MCHRRGAGVMKDMNKKIKIIEKISSHSQQKKTFCCELVVVAHDDEVKNILFSMLLLT